MKAELLYVRAWCRSKRGKTDGFVPDEWLESLAPVAKSHALERALGLADALIREGLWSRVEGGYAITDWFEWNPASDQLDARREAHRKGARKTNHLKYHKEPRVDCEHCLADQRSLSDSLERSLAVAEEQGESQGDSQGDSKSTFGPSSTNRSGFAESDDAPEPVGPPSEDLAQRMQELREALQSANASRPSAMTARTREP